jgi:hypothetical protein
MMRELSIKLRGSKAMGQSIAEYGIVISLVAAALLAMQVYMKRGIQAVIKQSTDQFSTQDYRETDASKVGQTSTTMDTTSESAYGYQQESVASGIRTTYTSNETSSNTGISTVTKVDEL